MLHWPFNLERYKASKVKDWFPTTDSLFPAFRSELKSRRECDRGGYRLSLFYMGYLFIVISTVLLGTDSLKGSWIYSKQHFQMWPFLSQQQCCSTLWLDILRLKIVIIFTGLYSQCHCDKRWTYFTMTSYTSSRSPPLVNSAFMLYFKNAEYSAAASAWKACKPQVFTIVIKSCKISRSELLGAVCYWIKSEERLIQVMQSMLLSCKILVFLFFLV